MRSKSLSPTPPQQARSRETHEGILTAAEQVFCEVGIAQATVAQICERAGVAVGTFYGRFPDKDALLLEWYERFHSRSRRAFDRAFSDTMWQGRSVTNIIRGWVQARVLHHRRNRHQLKAILLYVQGRPSAEFRPFPAQVRLPALARLTALMEARRHAWHHPQPTTAVQMAVVMTEATAQSVIVFSENKADEFVFADDELVDQLTEAMCAYLQVTEVPSRSEAVS